MIATRGLHHLAIQVRDLATVERFYAETLGLKVLRRWAAAGGTGDRSVWLETGGGGAVGDSGTGDEGGSRVGGGGDGAAAGGPSFLALEVVGADGPTAAEDAARAGRPGLHLVALRIDAGQRARWEERLAQAGVEIYHRTLFTLYVRDPEGNPVGLSHFPDHAGPTPGDVRG